VFGVLSVIDDWVEISGDVWELKLPAYVSAGAPAQLCVAV